MGGLYPAFLLQVLLVCVHVLTARADVCQQPPETGKCKADVPMYFFNSTSGTCEQFGYGGCEGNGNRFGTKKACMAACLKHVCSFQPEPGKCRAHKLRYFYNSTSATCELFVYGGCEGNGNRFSTKKACLGACSRKAVCQLPPAVGLCKAHMPMYYHNSTTDTCELFVFGGCGGNGNRFDTEAECLSACPPAHHDIVIH